MNLQEKILYCRKKAGLSQEALAEQLDVSRQAISKWETGEAAPEISKLILIAQVFNVSTDWLLSGDEPEEEKAENIAPEVKYRGEQRTWVDAAPGVIGKLIRRYGWLVGVYMAVVGALFTGLGLLTRYISKLMFDSFNIGDIFNQSPLIESSPYLDSFTDQVDSVSVNIMANNPVSIMGSVIIVLGVILIIAGIVLAAILKKRSKNE